MRRELPRTGRNEKPNDSHGRNVSRRWRQVIVRERDFGVTDESTIRSAPVRDRLCQRTHMLDARASDLNARASNMVNEQKRPSKHSRGMRPPSKSSTGQASLGPAPHPHVVLAACARAEPPVTRHFHHGDAVPLLIGGDRSGRCRRDEDSLTKAEQLQQLLFAASRRDDLLDELFGVELIRVQTPSHHDHRHPTQTHLLQHLSPHEKYR